MAPFLFLSTNGKSPRVNLRDALLTGQAPDRGLYFPERFPKLTTDEIAAFTQLHYHEVAFRVLSRYTEGVIEAGTLAQMCREIYNFEIPLEPVEGMERVYCLRLDCGPTASFKDFAAQMMARMFGLFLRETGRQIMVLTATSGDTGSAVAHAFHNIPGVRVLVLFPFAEISRHQRKLMTTLGENVRTIAVDGKFDDCQAMVKRAFADPALCHMSLSSATRATWRGSWLCMAGNWTRQAKATRRRTWPRCAATFSPVPCLTSGRGRHCGTRGRSTASSSSPTARWPGRGFWIGWQSTRSTALLPFCWKPPIRLSSRRKLKKISASRPTFRLR